LTIIVNAPRDPALSPYAAPRNGNGLRHPRRDRAARPDRASSRVAQWVRPDQAGRFTVDGLAPGVYLIAAVDQVTDDQWSNTEYLDELRPRATRVTLGDGEKRTMTLQRMSAP